MGRNGRKNWRVRGINSELRRRAAMKVLNNGLGNVMMERQKIARIASRTY
jgi:hypothetical protein